MKLMLIALVLFSVTQAFANYDGRILLTCRGTSFSDLKVVTLVQHENGKLTVVEQGDNGEVRRRSIESNSFDLGEISLSGWYGYTRTLLRENGGWELRKSDECRESQYSVSCVETR